MFSGLTCDIWKVCVSSLLISEIKRIIKESEIMKYYIISISFIDDMTDIASGKMTLDGLRRIKMVVRSLRFDWVMNISRLR